MFQKTLFSVVVITLLVLFQTKAFGQNAPNKKPDAPVAVELYFSSDPVLNQRSTLNFKVTFLQDAPRAAIKIDLPKDGITALSGDTELNEDLSKGETKIYKVDVLPVSLGQYKFTASATGGDGAYVFGKTVELFVVLDEKGTTVSRTDIFAGETATESKSEKISDLSQQLFYVPPSGKPNQNSKLFNFLAPGPGEIAVRGYWYYRDRNGVDKILRDARVEIWDSDTFSSDDLLATTRTNSSGYFESDNISNSGDESGNQDIYVKIYSTDDFAVRVTDFSGNIYSAQSQTLSNVPSGYVDTGSRVITDSNNRMAYFIFDKIGNDGYYYLYDNVGWANSYNLQVKWSPTSNDGTYYSLGGSVSLVAGDRWDSDVILHEYGHFVMYKIYGNSYPPSPNCNPHRWGAPSSLGCAWTEGWANFLQAAIQNNRFYDDTEDQNLHIDYEPPNPTVRYAEDEGAVAASLWDIFDAGVESWDSLNNGINGASNSGIWRISSVNRPNDLVQFYNSWNAGTNGFNSQMTSIVQHHNVIPDPVLTANLSISPAAPYVLGQTVTGRFSITNRGNRAITFEALTIGGRLNGDTTVVDFPAQTNITLSPNQTHSYVANLTLGQTGNYRFFPAYRLAGNVWRVGLLNEIPADLGVTYLLNFNVTQNTIPVTVQTNPSGLSITVDGTNYASPRTFNWTPGSSHTIGASSPQGNSQTRYNFSNWSDGGVTQNPRTVAPASGATYTANFTTQHYLTMNAGSGGSVSPQSGWRNAGEQVQISATPNSGYSFNGWSGTGSGSYTGANNSVSVTMSGPIQQTAGFTQVQCNYTLNPTQRQVSSNGGSGFSFSVTTTNQTCGWTPSTNAGWITTTSGSGPGGGTVTYNVAPNSDTTLRSGQIFVGGQVHTVFQDGISVCDYTISPTNRNFSANGGNGSFNVTAQSGCSWSVALTSSLGDDFVLQLAPQNDRLGSNLSLTGAQNSTGKSFEAANISAQHSPATIFNANPASLGQIPDGPQQTCQIPGSPRDVTFFVSGLNSNVSSVNLSMALTHTWSGDLVARLIAPNGSSQAIAFGYVGATSSEASGDESNLNGTYSFSDSAAATPSFWQAAANAPGSDDIIAPGNYRATTIGGSANGGQLTSINSVFAGLTPSQANGNWILRLTDGCAQDTGSISAANLDITTGGGQTGWITLQSPTSGSGNGVVNYFISSNSGQQPRQGTITLMGNNGQSRTHNINQEGTFQFGKAFDFDGDGKADISVFRPSNGAWYVDRSQAQFLGVQWGVSSDLLAPADFDGDRRTDYAVFRGGWWYILPSSTNQYYGVQFGSPGDLPRPGDFDGDGRADISVFRPSTGSWHRINSGNGQPLGIQFGQSGDTPLIADFDGDGKSDIAVTRVVDGYLYWYRLNSTNNQFVGAQWGIAADIPTPADFDGDGKTDISVFRPSNGGWYRTNSGNGQFFGVGFGLPGDIPVAADYDGDNKVDISVYRPSGFFWYRLNSGSANSFFAQQFGAGIDKPIPASYLR